MKWIKRLLILIAVGMVLIAVAALYSYRLARGVPVWYQPHQLTPDQQHAAANQVDQDLLSLLSYAADVTAAQRRAYHHPTEVQPAAGTGGAKTITISEDEADAFFAALTGGTTSTQPSGSGEPGRTEAALIPSDAGEKLSRYVADPRLAVSGDRLIFAATLKRGGIFEGTVASLALIPSIDDQGKLWLKIDQIYAGRLPVPQSAFAQTQDQLTQALRDKLSSLQGKAEFYKDGTANRAAAEVALMKIILSSLSDQPADPFIFLPAEMQSTKITVPLKLTQIQLQDGSLTFTLQPLSEKEQESLPTEFQAP